MHEMPPEGEDGAKLEKIRRSVDALDGRISSLDGATKLYESMIEHHTAPTELWAQVSGGHIPSR